MVNGKKYYETKWEVDERRVDQLMLHMGFQENLIGTHMMREAIKMWRPGIMFSKELYPALATMFNSTTARVERAMRTALADAWGRGNTTTKGEVFGLSVYATPEQPTVSQFVGRLHRACSHVW